MLRKFKMLTSGSPSSVSTNVLSSDSVSITSSVPVGPAIFQGVAELDLRLPAASAATASFFDHADVLSWPTRSQEVRSQYDRCLPPASSPVRLHLSSQLLHSCFHFRLPPAVALSRWYGLV